jgi:hypothetical protein
MLLIVRGSFMLLLLLLVLHGIRPAPANSCTWLTAAAAAATSRHPAPPDDSPCTGSPAARGCCTPCTLRLPLLRCSRGRLRTRLLLLL